MWPFKHRAKKFHIELFNDPVHHNHPRHRIRSINGEIIESSESYSSNAAAEKTACSLSEDTGMEIRDLRVSKEPK